mmetsp:Transcript_76514/g.159187  ORF Transcript_76514/g.159187 Transcript_76514/m.159187 type:complete len:205 (+) Transcript_76514:494-1108(+)
MRQSLGSLVELSAQVCDGLGQFSTIDYIRNARSGQSILIVGWGQLLPGCWSLARDLLDKAGLAQVGLQGNEVDVRGCCSGRLFIKCPTAAHVLCCFDDRRLVRQPTKGSSLQNLANLVLFIRTSLYGTEFVGSLPVDAVNPTVLCFALEVRFDLQILGEIRSLGHRLPSQALAATSLGADAGTSPEVHAEGRPPGGRKEWSRPR